MKLFYPRYSFTISGGSRISRRGGRGPRRRGCELPRQLRFENFVCQNVRIGTLRGGGTCQVYPLDPPMTMICLHQNIPPGMFWRKQIIAKLYGVHFERGYNPRTPSKFWNNPKDSDIGWHTHLGWDWWSLPSGEAALASPLWQTLSNSSLDWASVGVTLGLDSEVSVGPWLVSVGDNTRTRLMTSV